MKIVDIIKYEGDNSTFVWKHPMPRCQWLMRKNSGN